MEAEAEPKIRADEQLKILQKQMAPRKFVASRKELVGFGFWPIRIDNWCRGGRLVQVLHGVYSYGRDIETRAAALKAGLLIAGPGSVLTGRSACEEWGFVESRREIPRQIDVAVAAGKATTHLGRSPAMSETRVVVVHREYAPRDIRRLNGLAVASPALALIELAVHASERQLRFAFLEACRLRMLNRDDVRWSYQLIYGRRGAKKFRPLLAMWVPELNQIRSVYEGLYLLEWIDSGYPMPKVNFKVLGREVDLYWPQQRFVLELDGGAFHSDPLQRNIDFEKQRFLEASGLEVERLPFETFDADPGSEIQRVANRLGFA